MPREVTLVVVDRHGGPLGVLPPFHADPPYWQEVAGLVDHAHDTYGVDITVLRLLDGTGEDGTAVGGRVTYLVEADRLPPHYHGPVPSLPAQPLRHPYAEPGGPARTVGWAVGVLDAEGYGPVMRTRQLRTWNLSAIWRLDTAVGPFWVKQVPPFLGHEATVLRWVARHGPGLVPTVLAASDGRMLLGHVPGEDRYDGGPAVCEAIDAALHPVRVAAAAMAEDLVTAGVPDARAPTLLPRLRSVVARHAPGDDGLRALVDTLPARMARVRRCGLPDTLVHGDLHPGNTRSAAGTVGPPVIVDWGDSFVGHPGFDILRLSDRLEPTNVDSLLEAWASRWRVARPGSDPLRAVELLRPVAALRNAAVYARFLDHIEPAEHTYHALDVPHWLTVASRLSTSD
jgi:hypothetical protein